MNNKIAEMNIYDVFVVGNQIKESRSHVSLSDVLKSHDA